MAEKASQDSADELVTLVSALRAYAEWVAESGGVGLPTASDAVRREREPNVDEERPSVAFPEHAPAQTAEPSAASTLSGAPTASEPRAMAHAAEPPGTARSPVPRGAPAQVTALGLEERRHRLEVLRAEVAGCTRCGLHRDRTQTVFARGTGSCGLCFVGEGPGADEDAQGYPFVGKAGQLLDRMIAAMGFGRDEVYVCNIVKCRPPKNRKPEPEEMATCVPFLHEQLELVEPEVIVALGATAVQGLLGTTEGITRLRGRWRLYRGKIAVMPTFHPAYLLRTPRAKRDVWEDLQAVLRQMGRPIPNQK